MESKRFSSAEESLSYFESRFAQYPLHREFMGLYGTHDDELIVDYGCGPGNDTVGYLINTRARKVIGIDVSATALSLARARIEVHKVDPTRYELQLTSDREDAIELADGSADYIHCSGVLQHVGDPKAALRELNRVLKPGGRGVVMVYNRNSIWFHLFTAYQRMIVEGRFSGLSVQEAFSKNTDSPDCPVSRCWPPADFVALLASSGFAAQYVGGNLSLTELECLATYRGAAVGDGRLAEEHKRFLRELQSDSSGNPTYRGFAAGIGAVYRLQKVT